MGSTDWRDEKYAKDVEKKQEKNNRHMAVLAKMQEARAAKGHAVTRKHEMPKNMVGRIDENNNIIDPESEFEDDDPEDDPKLSRAGPKPVNRLTSIPGTKMLPRSRKRQAESIEDEAEKKIKINHHLSMKTTLLKKPASDNHIAEHLSFGLSSRFGGNQPAAARRKALPKSQVDKLAVASTKSLSSSTKADSENKLSSELDETKLSKPKRPSNSETNQIKADATAEVKAEVEDNTIIDSSKPQFLGWRVNKRTGVKRPTYTLPETREEKKAAKKERVKAQRKEKYRRQIEKAKEKQKAQRTAVGSGASTQGDSQPNSDLEEGEIKESGSDSQVSLGEPLRQFDPQHGRHGFGHPQQGERIPNLFSATDAPKSVYESYRPRDYDGPRHDRKAGNARSLYDLY